MRCKDTIMTANLMPSTDISHPSIITRRSSSSSTSIGSSSRRTKIRLEVAKKQSSWHSKLSPNKWTSLQGIRIYTFYRVIPSYKFIMYIQLLEINVTNEQGLKSPSIVYTRPMSGWTWFWWSYFERPWKQKGNKPDSLKVKKRASIFQTKCNPCLTLRSNYHFRSHVGFLGEWKETNKTTCHSLRGDTLMTHFCRAKTTAAESLSLFLSLFLIDYRYVFTSLPSYWSHASGGLWRASWKITGCKH